jgi:hypothetical protein
MRQPKQNPVMAIAVACDERWRRDGSVLMSMRDREKVQLYNETYILYSRQGITVQNPVDLALSRWVLFDSSQDCR